MHDMSNTRKEIAARLGFAAGNGAKIAFQRYEIGDAFKFEDKIYVINSHSNEINAVLSSADSNAKKALSLADFAHAKWLQFEGKAKSTRPGAKVAFAIDARDELMMRTWIKNNYPKADNATFNKMLAKMTKEYAKDPKGYTYGGGFRAVAKAAGFSRDGAKLAFAGDIETKLRSLISRFGFKPDNISASSRFGVAHVEFIDQKGKATEMVSKLKGAMKQMGVPESAITARENQYPADQDGPAQHIGIVTIDFGQMKSSRPGTKTRMTREQTEEQKAGLKIMSAADPVVGAKIAKLIKEGKPQDQAVAIALDMKRRGEL